MKILLLEFPWQLNAVINNRNTYKDNEYIIVSLDPECSYLLKSNKIKYFEAYEFCKHSEFWIKYREITNHSLKIAKVLDKALWSLDPRFKELNWKLFDDYHYFLKGPYDQLLYYSTLIYKLIEKFNPSEIIVVNSKKILIEDNFLINSNISIIKYLLEGLEKKNNKIKIKYFLEENKKNDIKFFANVFKINLFSRFNIFVKKRVKNLLNKIKFLIDSYTTNYQYLSIDSHEVSSYKKLYPSEAKFYLSYNYQSDNFKKKKNNSIFFENFINYLNNKTEFNDLIRYKEISFLPIFRELLIKLTGDLNYILKKYRAAEKIINRTKPKCLIFNSMNPSSLETLIFRKNCNNKNIPYFVWSHGGYGLTYSFSSFDVTDFRFCKNHISYGDHMEVMTKDDECILKDLNFKENQKVFAVGSPKFDLQNKKKSQNILFKKSNKKKILFLSGGLVDKNLFYFGRNREKYETSLWEFHYDVLLLLQKYQNKYDIIFKDYPNGKKNLWKKVIKDINGDKISFISNEYKTNELLRISDLNILPWASTTFFESLYFDADIFVIEEDMSKKILETSLNNEIFYFKRKNFFLLELEKYLNKGDFYLRNKSKSRNYFLKHDHLNKRDNLLNKALNNI